MPEPRRPRSVMAEVEALGDEATELLESGDRGLTDWERFQVRQVVARAYEAGGARATYWEHRAAQAEGAEYGASRRLEECRRVLAETQRKLERETRRRKSSQRAVSAVRAATSTAPPRTDRWDDPPGSLEPDDSTPPYGVGGQGEP